MLHYEEAANGRQIGFAPKTEMITPKRRQVTNRCLALVFATAQVLALLSILLSASGASGQQASDQKTKQPPPSMGVATGAAHPAIKDSHSRPITAGNANP